MALILHTKVEKRLEAAKYEALLEPLPADIRQKIRRYRRWQDAHACLLGKLLLIEGLQRFGLDGASLIHQLQYTDFGRPYLPAPVDFNISHSGEYVLCALSNRCRVGVDIEKVQPINLSDFRGQMTEAEWATVTGAANPLRAFYYYWTRKEAAIKAHGHGLSLPLKEVVIGEGEVMMEGRGWPLYEVELPAKYICHLVTDGRVEESDIRVEGVGFLKTPF
ncbi:MAG: 4'-phosphopantetheinyl transferase superfamily protein [Lewinellaceae bacterium]|nr:4'-phosphopantetheinyl transferase superfamily protein [Lewinellaceae bacterium]